MLEAGARPPSSVRQQTAAAGSERPRSAFFCHFWSFLTKIRKIFFAPHARAFRRARSYTRRVARKARLRNVEGLDVTPMGSFLRQKFLLDGSKALLALITVVLTVLNSS